MKTEVLTPKKKKKTHLKTHVYVLYDMHDSTLRYNTYDMHLCIEWCLTTYDTHLCIVSYDLYHISNDSENYGARHISGIRGLRSFTR